VTPHRGRGLGRLSCAILLGLWLVPAAAPAQDAAPPVRERAMSGPGEAPPRDDSRRTVARLPANLFRAAIGIFSPDSVKPLIAGGAATGTAAIVDDEVASALANPAHDFGQALESAGAPLWTGAVVGALFVAGRLGGGGRFRAASYDWLDAVVVTGAYTELLKALTRRERPNGEDSRSFPSGHASNAFALAAVAERHYGWKVGVPAYGLAALVGASRLQREKHYLSDVLAGATLGYIVGRTVVRVNGQPGSSRGGSAFSVSPMIARRTRALVVNVVF
jgi:membrane-associated phospholipid phosphatase